MNAPSGTYGFEPSLGELTLYSFNLAGVRQTALTQSHMASALMAANLINGRWSAMGVNLWSVDLQTIQLVPGNATYSVPRNTVAILDAYATRGQGAGLRNRPLVPISRTEFASYSNPNQPGAVSVYWYDQLLAPSITLYMCPDGTDDSLSYYRLRQMQDSQLVNAASPELPFYFLEAYAYALGQRLAQVWNPALAAGLKTLADESYEIAANRNTEQAAFYITPQIAGYFRT
jgi:hypothetical protein